MYFEPYNFGSIGDVSQVVEYNKKKFQKCFMCGICALTDSEKLCSSGDIKLHKTQYSENLFYKHELADENNNIHSVIYSSKEHISKQFFIFSRDIFKTIINYKIDGLDEDSSDAMGLYWTLESRDNYGDHLFFEERILSSIDKTPEFVFDYYEVNSNDCEDVRRILLSKMEMNKYFDIFITNNKLYVYTNNSKDLLINRKSFEFQLATQNKDLCFHDEIEYELNAESSLNDIATKIQSGKACLNSLDNCDKDELYYLSYLISRYFTCKVNSSSDDPLVVYSKILTNKIFYNFALNTNIFIERKVIDSVLATKIIERHINDLLLLNDRYYQIGNSKIAKIAKEEYLKMDVFKYKKNGGPNFIKAGAYGAILDAKFAGFPIVIKIDRKFDKTSGKRPDADVFLHEFLVGIELNDESCVPKTLGMFLCPSNIGIETKEKFELCAPSKDSVETSFIILEKIDAISFREYIIKENDEKYIIGYLIEIFSNLDMLHKKYRFFHNDLHSENILIDKKTNKIKFIDFGLSSTKNYGSLRDMPIGGQIYTIITSLMIDGAQNIYTRNFSAIEKFINTYLQRTKILLIKSMEDYWKYIGGYEIHPSFQKIGEDLRLDREHIYQASRDYSEYYYESYKDVINDLEVLLQ
jgi:hypothetical protein